MRAIAGRGWAMRWGLALLWVLALVMPGASFAALARPVVYVVPIEGVIDLGLAPFVERVLQEATGVGAAAVILEVDTFGGRVDAAVLIRDTLLRAKVKTVAFINKRAISAGALISLATETIVMADGGTIGAATPVQIGLPGAPAQPVEEKTVSYMRKEFRATAESRKRPPELAEAMVDADVEISGVIAKGKLLTLTTEEAWQHKLVDFRADNMERVLELLGLADAELRRASETWAESLVRIFTHPIVSSILIAVGMLGIIVEIQSPGFGVPGVVGLTSLALFLWGHWLVRLAGWEEVLLIGIGLILLVVEIFLLPGFGLFGAIGIVALLGGLGLSLVGTGATWAVVLYALGQVIVAVLLAVVLALALLRVLPRLPFGRRLILETELPAQAGYASALDTDRRWLGKRGIAASTLRPAGIAHFDHERVDVITEGEFIEAGDPIEVLRVEGNRIVVRRIDQDPERSES
ncbi:NfeD family protein [Nitrospira defluvii]|uniref:Membrane-bound serine protease n=1 Tax=Nitrospira defluvii TaxID=330214 RepID=A0ABM8R9C7_9BACT|nr:NfeD family protein [Nitrospira defluvii]CAE6740377.1 Membrane-bound serine protease [Nitrospira defluvii]